MAAPEEERVFAAVESCTCRAANPVADLIAHDGAKHHRQKEPSERNEASGRKNARGDKQRISWKKEADKEAGFDKNNGADERGPAGVD